MCNYWAKLRWLISDTIIFQNPFSILQTIPVEKNEVLFFAFFFSILNKKTTKFILMLNMKWNRYKWSKKQNQFFVRSRLFITNIIHIYGLVLCSRTYSLSLRLYFHENKWKLPKKWSTKYFMGLDCFHYNKIRLYII